MKAVATREEEKFKPITLTLTIESKDELEALYQIGYHHEQVKQVLTDHKSSLYDICETISSAAHALYSALYGIRNA